MAVRAADGPQQQPQQQQQSVLPVPSVGRGLSTLAEVKPHGPSGNVEFQVMVEQQHLTEGEVRRIVGDELSKGIGVQLAQMAASVASLVDVAKDTAQREAKAEAKAATQQADMEEFRSCLRTLMAKEQGPAEQAQPPPSDNSPGIDDSVALSQPPPAHPDGAMEMDGDEESEDESSTRSEAASSDARPSRDKIITRSAKRRAVSKSPRTPKDADPQFPLASPPQRDVVARKVRSGR